MKVVHTTDCSYLIRIDTERINGDRNMLGRFSILSISNSTGCEDGFPSEYNSSGIPVALYTQKYISFAFVALLLTILEIAGILFILRCINNV